jgi:Flp pilus assembly protein CpaB
MLMIAQAIPYIAFAGAAVLVGWVAVDVMRARLRKVKVKVDGPKAPDYDRGLAEKAKPMSTRLQARPIREETYVSDSVLEIPTTQAQDLETAATETEATGPAVEPDAPESAPQEFVP